MEVPISFEHRSNDGPEVRTVMDEGEGSHRRGSGRVSFPATLSSTVLSGLVKQPRDGLSVSCYPNVVDRDGKFVRDLHVSQVFSAGEARGCNGAEGGTVVDEEGV